MDQETTTWVLVALLVLALVGVVVAIVVGRRRSRAAAAAATARVEATETAHRQELERVSASHDEGVSSLEAQHARERDELDARRRDAEERAEQSQEFATRSMRWDEPSQRAVVDACTELGLDGVLVTNVVFVPVDAPRTRRFVAQVDHVLLLSSAAVVIENKGWKGVVLDGVQPRDVHSSIGTLFGDATFEAPFAVQVSRESPTSFRITSHEGRESPAAQVRRQAQRVSDLVGAETSRTQWFDTAVFYSHPDAEVWAAETDATQAGVTTTIVAGGRQLRSFLERVGDRPRTLAPTRIDELAELFARHGADVRRFGAMAVPEGR